MRCDELRDLLPLLPLDLLEAGEEESVRAHLDAGCPRCGAELAAAREVLDLLPCALPPEEPSEMARARLMTAVRQAAAPAPQRPARAFARALGASLAAGLIAAILTGAILGRRHERIAEDLRLRIERQSEELASLRLQVRQAHDSIRLASSPGLRVFDLEGQGALADARARLFWDPRGAAWQLFAVNLPPAGAGKTYQLWLITAGRKISAGTFEGAVPEAQVGRVAVPPEEGPILAAAVTDEPTGGSPQPTGSIVLLGKV